ncbi:unnamed protein product [Allacma fusca]|uniref:Ribosomal protein L46 N-terminal domain-containing protein n=1 Tax=Allacma fusca TaxID=39272 RepID=A0A8J2LER3_9HEXA|nr:unnamed protein product [Allacma fusca]
MIKNYKCLQFKQTLGKDDKWIVPHMKLTEQESLRQAAQDALTLFCPDVKARVLGNAPWGVYKYNYPKVVRGSQEADGCKVFFYKAQLLSGQMNLPKDKTVSSSVKDYAWLTRAELPEYFAKEYFRSISELLIPEY